MSELFDAVDALVASRAPLPPAEERKRLRQAHGLTLDDVAAALKVRRATVSGWESVKKTTEPRGPEREAYARLLDKLAELYPAPAAAPAAVPSTLTGQPAPEERALSAAPASEAAAMTEHENTQTTPTSAPAAPVEQAAPRPARTARSTSTSRRPGTRKAAPARTPAGGTDPRFENGPLAVVDVDADGQVLAYCTGGLVLDGCSRTL
jgi:transcriptional regulator with XRE-family HTH domain